MVLQACLNGDRETGVPRSPEELAAEARAFAARCHELTQFLVDVLGVRQVTAALAGKVTYHDSCSGLRELGVKHQPRTLLASVLAGSGGRSPSVAALEVRPSNVEARTLYGSLGFRVVGRRRGYSYDTGEDALVMEARLTADSAGGREH